MSTKKDNVIRLYDVRPEMALERLKRSTGLDFNKQPESLVQLVRRNEALRMRVDEVSPPVLIDVVDVPVFKKGCNA